MAQAIYAVIAHGSGWTISHDGKHFGTFADAAAATAMALETARAAAAAGHDAQVAVQQAGGDFRIAWRSAGG